MDDSGSWICEIKRHADELDMDATLLGITLGVQVTNEISDVLRKANK